MRFSAIQNATDRLVAMVIEHEVRMSTRTLKPPLDTILILSNGLGDRVLGHGTVRVGGSR